MLCLAKKTKKKCKLQGRRYKSFKENIIKLPDISEARFRRLQMISCTKWQNFKCLVLLYAGWDSSLQASSSMQYPENYSGTLSRGINT